MLTGLPLAILRWKGSNDPSSEDDDVIDGRLNKKSQKGHFADTAGVTERTVRTDLSTGNFAGSEDAMVTNSRGQQRPATYQRAEPDDDVIDGRLNKTGQMSSFVDDDVIDAEIVYDDDTPCPPTPSALSAVPVPSNGKSEESHGKPMANAWHNPCRNPSRNPSRNGATPSRHLPNSERTRLGIPTTTPNRV